MKDRLIIGTRASNLAIAQAEIVRSYLQGIWPSLEVELLPLSSSGDRILDSSLEKAGGKGLFVKELDAALREKRTDLSVHSLKDVPMEVPKELPLVAYSRRETPEDALVLPQGAKRLDLAKPIGCSSRRRMLQFQALYPDARFRLIRGNVETRLKRLDSGEYAATILAASGLIRLGLEDRISRLFTTEEMLPSAGQGILAVQGRAGEDYSFLSGFNDAKTEAEALAERALVRALGGNCSTPIGAYAQAEGDRLTLSAFCYDDQTNQSFRGSASGAIDEPEQLGQNLARQLKGEK